MCRRNTRESDVWNRLDKSKLFHPAADFYGAIQAYQRHPSPRAIERNPYPPPFLLFLDVTVIKRVI
jgi:hypothetical protein